MARKPDDPQTRIGELEDELKQRYKRIEELNRDLDEARNLIDREREHIEDAAAVLEQWREAFEMKVDDDGKWSAADWCASHDALVDKYNDLLREWNKFVPEYNAAVAKRPVGRPLAASDAQVATVRRLHKQGLSLRAITDETSLSFATVRTIVDQSDGTDRTTQLRRERLGLERIPVDKLEVAKRKRQKRTRDALPKLAQDLVEGGDALIKEAKGLGRDRLV
jgi:hypothetical protein